MVLGSLNERGPCKFHGTFKMNYSDFCRFGSLVPAKARLRVAGVLIRSRVLTRGRKKRVSNGSYQTPSLVIREGRICVDVVASEISCIARTMKSCCARYAFSFLTPSTSIRSELGARAFRAAAQRRKVPPSSNLWGISDSYLDVFNTYQIHHSPQGATG